MLAPSGSQPSVYFTVTFFCAKTFFGTKPVPEVPQLLSFRGRGGDDMDVDVKARAVVPQRADPHRFAHLGAVDVALEAAAATLRETAAWIDAHPLANAQREAMRARLVVENAANAVMQHATRTLGAGPLCRDARFARALADLPVFLRQSHAERDLAALGELLATAHADDDATAAGGLSWTL